MKKYLTVLLALVALPVFGAGGGWTLLGSPLSKTLGNGTGIICGEIPSYSSGWGENMDVYTNCLYTDANTLPNGYVELWWTVVTNCPTIQHNPIDMIYTTYWSPLDSPGLWTALASVTNNFIETNWLSSRVASDYTWLTNGYYTVVALETNYVSGANANWVYTTNCIGCATVNTNPGALVWVTNSTVYQTGNRSIAFSVALDATNNVYICGIHLGTNYIGTNALASLNSLDQAAFVAKLDSNGRPIWTRTLHEYPITSTAIKCTGIACDSSGNVIVCGLFAGTVDFGAGAVTSTGGARDPDADIFVAKYDPNNNLLWLKTPTGGLYDQADAVKVDTNDDVVVVGHFMSNTGSGGALDWGDGHILSNIGFFNIAVAKLSKTNGACLWASQIGNAGTSTSYAIGTDNNGNVFAIGAFYNGNVVKFNSAGVFQWANGDTSLAYSGTADTNGNVIIQSKVGTSLYLKGYSTSGALLWSYQNHDNNTVDVGYGVAVNRNNLLAIVGADVTGIYFTGLDNWRQILLVNGMQNQYISVYSLSGTNPPTPIWQNQLAFGWPAALSQALGVAFDSSGNVVVCGDWLAPLDFGGWTVTPSTSQSTPAKIISTYSYADYLLYVAKYRK